LAEVRFEGVTKVFGKDVKAVDNLTLRIDDGEFMVLVGPSGCGKTTALRMVAGLEEATEGDLYIGENRVNDVPPKDRDIAMVFQNYALYPHMTVYENIAFGLKLRELKGLVWQVSHFAEARAKRKEIDDRVHEVARMLAIDQLLHRRPKELSGGQRQRVALGRAIARKPRVFLMDEPLSNLDAKLRIQTRAELIRLHRALGVTTVYVTHDQVEAMTMGQRIAVMHNGVLQQCDTPEAVYNAPANRFVAGFIGSPPMNFVDGTVLDGHIDLGPFTIGLPEGHPVRARQGSEVTLGIRPEAIYDSSAKCPVPVTPDNSFMAQVDVLEKLGPEDTAYLDAQGLSLTASLDPATRIHAGATARFAVDTGKLHFFDKRTEAAIR
jgi:multiple sugar transport system ATP-binding protein